METQLKRTFSGTIYYCEFIGDYIGAQRKKSSAKYAKFKARVIKLSYNRYACFIA